MALIPCPECQRQVSDRAPACPSCGHAIAAPTPGAAGASAAMPPAAPAFVPLPGAAMPFTSSGATGEKVMWEGGPSPRLMARELPGALWALIAVPCSLVLLPNALKVVAGLNKEFKAVIAEQGSTLRTLVIGGVVILSLVRLGRAALRYARLRGTRYRVTNQRLTIDSGLFAKRVDDIDLRSVEDVGLEQSALERLLGVGRLNIVSTDRARPRLELYGIPSPRDVREQLRAGVYEASQRQIFTRAT